MKHRIYSRRGPYAFQQTQHDFDSELALQNFLAGVIEAQGWFTGHDCELVVVRASEGFGGILDTAEALGMDVEAIEEEMDMTRVDAGDALEAEAIEYINATAMVIFIPDDGDIEFNPFGD